MPRAFRKFLSDMAQLKKYELQDFSMWKEWLIYGTSLGVGKKVAEAMKQLNISRFGVDVIPIMYTSFHGINLAVVTTGRASAGAGHGGGFGGGGGGINNVNRSRLPIFLNSGCGTTVDDDSYDVSDCTNSFPVLAVTSAISFDSGSGILTRIRPRRGFAHTAPACTLPRARHATTFHRPL
jgi:hypothetical protein